MDSVDYYNKYANVYFDNTVNLDMGETLERFLSYCKPGDCQTLPTKRSAENPD